MNQKENREAKKSRNQGGQNRECAMVYSCLRLVKAGLRGGYCRMEGGGEFGRLDGSKVVYSALGSHGKTSKRQLKFKILQQKYIGTTLFEISQVQ